MFCRQSLSTIGCSSKSSLPHIPREPLCTSCRSCTSCRCQYSYTECQLRNCPKALQCQRPRAWWLAHLYVFCKGGDGKVGGRNLSLPTRVSLVGGWPRLSS